jgi:hypothetical protein
LGKRGEKLTDTKWFQSLCLLHHTVCELHLVQGGLGHLAVLVANLSYLLEKRFDDFRVPAELKDNV